MNNKSKAHTRNNFGGGGIKCPCCRLSNSIKESRTKLNRALRRKSKQNSEKEFDSGESVE
jgi:cytochrome c-type biogenesis protein CcmH/NrfF